MKSFFPWHFLALLVVLLLTIPHSAAWADTAGDTVPRVTAVLDEPEKCVRSSVRWDSPESISNNALRPAQAWSLTQGSGVDVAVLDTGFDRDSPQLKKRLKISQAISEVRTASDCVGHGTFVAGLIAARSVAGSPMSGIAPQAELLGIKVTDDTGATSPDLISRGIEEAIAAGAKIILVSVVSPQSSNRLEAAVSRAGAKGAVVIAPATADDRSSSVVAYPGALKNVLSVGQSENDGRSGSALPVPHLTAPGQAVLSTCPGGGTCIGTGSAYAAALVAGTLALVDAYHPGLSREQRMRRLFSTAYPVTATDAPPAIYGIVDPDAAVTAASPDADSISADSGPMAMKPIAVPATFSAAFRTALGIALSCLTLLVLSLCVVLVGQIGRTPGRGLSSELEPAEPSALPANPSGDQ